MSSTDYLVHYDPKLPLVLATDASPVGVGAVLSHIYPDGTERPIQFASQTLTPTQQRYSQFDREAYAIVYGVKRFYQYVYARHFILQCDNKPVTNFFTAERSSDIISDTHATLCIFFCLHLTTKSGTGNQLNMATQMHFQGYRKQKQKRQSLNSILSTKLHTKYAGYSIRFG